MKSRRSMMKISATIFLALLLLGATQARAQDCSRISFARGRTTAVINGKVDAKKSACYNLRARKGQQMIVHLTVHGTSPKHNVYFQISPEPASAEESTDVLPGASNVADWEGTIPYTNDYGIVVIADKGSYTFTLEVTIR
ncbi:MAG TPA: hypothetical protein VHQ95_01185 [Pyrinomonadaceae bacterium]|nr:hypothetical protein [Pyrinomonadaceae bacterium]